jgi:prepilin-type N-terminal cleavage/methylation domain-containing protein
VTQISNANLRVPARRHTARGFTMIEVMIAVAVVFVVSAMAVMQMQPTVQQSRANAGMAEVVSGFRQAQSYAVAYRRFVQITFPNYPAVGSNQMQITIKNSMTPNAGNDVILATLALEGSVTFQLVTGMTDTPDGFGNASSIEFEGVSGGPTAGMFFQPDGTFVDITGNPVNGTCFLSVNGFTSAARAVTVLGTTGRVKSYRGNPSNGWIQSF